MASWQAKGRDPLFDQNTQAALERRGKELIGAGLVVLAAVLVDGLDEVDDAVREEILEELSPETVAEGVRDLDTDTDEAKRQATERIGQLEQLRSALGY